MKSLISVILILVLFSSCSFFSKEENQQAKKNKYLYFMKDRDDNKESIYRLSLDSGEEILIKENALLVSEPVNDKIVYSDNITSLNSAVYISDLDGSNEVKLLDSAFLPVFSPSGKYIAYISENGSDKNWRKDLNLYNLESKESLILTEYGRSESSPCFSKDSKFIYYYSSHSGRDSLLKISIDGKQIKVLDSNLLQPDEIESRILLDKENGNILYNGVEFEKDNYKILSPLDSTIASISKKDIHIFSISDSKIYYGYKDGDKENPIIYNCITNYAKDEDILIEKIEKKKKTQEAKILTSPINQGHEIVYINISVNFEMSPPLVRLNWEKRNLRTNEITSITPTKDISLDANDIISHPYIFIY